MEAEEDLDGLVNDVQDDPLGLIRTALVGPAEG